MKKAIIIVIGFILLLAVIILLILNLIEATPMYKNEERFRNTFDLELEGEIIDIESDGALRIACLKVEKSNYKEYRRENDEFFIRVKDSLAVMIYSVKKGEYSRYHIYKVGSQILINHNNNKKIIELEGKDTIDTYGMLRFPVRDYLKNSCIPD